MRKTIKILGTFVGIGTAVVTGLGRFSNLLGILGLPDEAKEALVLMSGAPTIVPVVALLIGLFCAGYLVYDSGHHTLALAALKKQPIRVDPSHLIIGGLAVIIVGAVIVAIGLWMQPKSLAGANPSPPVVQQQPAAPDVPSARPRQLSRTDYERRSRLIIDVFQLANTQVRPAFDDLWGIYNDQPRLINSNQKGVYDTMVSARAKLIEANNAVGPLVRESELYPDIRGLSWNFQQPILNSLNELINKLRVPIGNNTLIFIDSKETDQLKQGIDVLGKWIEDTKAALAKIKESDDAAVIVAAIDSRDKTFTPGIGTPPRRERVTIQWNEIFGTTSAVDRVFALFLDGHGPASKSTKLKRAYLESAKTGEVIEMNVAGETAVDEAFPISEANPIPPNGFIRLVAVMNPSDNPKGTQNGLLNREFLDRWGSIWFNAIYEDGTPPDRISFDTTGYFPEISGPHATRRPDAKKE